MPRSISNQEGWGPRLMPSHALGTSIRRMGRLLTPQLTYSPSLQPNILLLPISQPSPTHSHPLNPPIPTSSIMPPFWILSPPPPQRTPLHDRWMRKLSPCNHHVAGPGR